MKATHYIGSFQRVAGDYTFRVEAFYKKYKDLVKTAPDTSTTGTGYAKVLSCSGAIARPSRTLITGYLIPTSIPNVITCTIPLKYSPDFAAKHTASLVLKKWFPKITTNVGLTYTLCAAGPATIRTCRRASSCLKRPSTSIPSA